jgi:hypothetical protein
MTNHSVLSMCEMAPKSLKQLFFDNSNPTTYTILQRRATKKTQIQSYFVVINFLQIETKCFLSFFFMYKSYIFRIKLRSN